ncbi:MAG: hypothetical protein ABIP80_04325 [Ferruginibacter sp.]
MKKNMMKLSIISFCLLLIACIGGKESASSIAKKWCDLNGKAHKAAEGSAKEAAETSLSQFENEMEARYKDDKVFMKEIEKEVEKCEASSEGR